MILILRKIKYTVFNNAQFHRYLLYASGEMLLVVIGILVALQINNWNSEQQREASLQSYLGSIARNIRKDLVEVEYIRSRRENTIGLSGEATGIVWDRSTSGVEEIAIASYALSDASALLHFNANMSGYETLKSSGVLDRMQGRDIENLLYDYYDTVSRISRSEDNHNEFLRQHLIQIRADWPHNLTQWEFENPTQLTPERVLELGPGFTELLTNPNLISIYLQASTAASLLLEYERLDLLGRAFIRTIENGSMAFDQTTLEMLESIYDPEKGTGYPVVVTDGQVYWANYFMIKADSLIKGLIGSPRDSESRNSLPRLKTTKQEDGSLHVNYPGGADWAALFFKVRGSSNSRKSQDFSMYEKLQLELKGDTGGETISLHMKDRDDPDDGSQTNVELQLTDQWEKYEIDLAAFKSADLSKLHVVVGVLFHKEPQSFAVRVIRFQ